MSRSEKGSVQNQGAPCRPVSDGQRRNAFAGAWMNLTIALLVSAVMLLSGCQTSRRVEAVASEATAVRSSLIDGYPAFPSGDHTAGLFNFVVEIPAGTNDKWEVDKETGGLFWEEKNGRPRVVQYLSYPGNYGMIPSTTLPYAIGGDGDPLDVILLGPSAERGSVVLARPIGLLRLLDNGERDDKILAVQVSGPLSDVRDLTSLDAKYGGVRYIVETWFTNYKGPGEIASSGFGDADEALAVIQEANRYFLEK